MAPAKQLLILAAIAGAVGAAWWFDAVSLIGGGEAAPRQTSARAAKSAAPVVVERVRTKSDAAVIQAVGTGDANKSITVFPRAVGQVAEVLFAAGKRVEKGAALIKLDDEDEAIAVKLAELTLRDARLKLERYRRIVRSGGVSRTEVEAVETTVEEARLRLALAKIAFSRRTVKAPFAGVVGIPAVEVGDRVTETTAVTTLDDRSVLLVDFEVPETFIYGLREGAVLTATTWALPGEVFEGVLATLASRIEKDTRTLRVRAELPNDKDRLRPGMGFSIRLPLAGNRFPSVPSVSIQWQRKGAYVWAVRDGKAHRVAVDVLKRSDGWVLVDAKLTAGDRIVVEGVQRLRQGIEVEIVVRADDDAAGKPTQ